MKKFFILSAAISLLACNTVFIPQSSAADAPKAEVAKKQMKKANWITDYNEALKQAKAANKPILMDFTGSDWCGWCIKLNKEVFSKSDFIKYANENLILLEIDFPRDKEQTQALKEQNEKLSKQFQITGFPTIILLDSDGKQIGKMGYQKGGAVKYVDTIKSVIEAQKK